MKTEYKIIRAIIIIDMKILRDSLLFIDSRTKNALDPRLMIIIFAIGMFSVKYFGYVINISLCSSAQDVHFGLFSHFCENGSAPHSLDLKRGWSLGQDYALHRLQS